MNILLNTNFEIKILSNYIPGEWQEASILFYVTSEPRNEISIFQVRLCPLTHVTD